MTIKLMIDLNKIIMKMSCNPPLNPPSPENLSFHVARLTLEKVTTPTRVSRRVDQVELKSTRFGLRDMIDPTHKKAPANKDVNLYI